MAAKPPTGIFASRVTSVKRARENINMPGVNEEYTNSTNKYARGAGNTLKGRPNVDTPQNVISTTAIHLPPPVCAEDPEINPDIHCYAPHSKNPIANIPQRGEFAFIPIKEQGLPDVTSWYARSVSSSHNTYGNAVPVCTNAAGVLIGTKFRFAGIVGNAGQAHDTNGEKDRYGQVYSAGAISGRNTGPQYIPPMTPVYATPHPFVIVDEKGNKKPGYRDPGWPEGLDKYLFATYPLRDTDTMAYFRLIENKMDEAAKKGDLLQANKIKSLLGECRAHEHLPAWLYAEQYAYFANFRAAPPDYIIRGHKAAVACIEKVIEYWKKIEKLNDQVMNAMGAPSSKEGEGKQLKHALVVQQEIKHTHKVHDAGTYAYIFSRLSEIYMDIFKFQFAEQENFKRSQLIGKSTYGSPSTQGLDLISGYAF